MFNLKSLFILLFVFSSFFVVSQLDSSSAFAQRTCCVTGDTGCKSCDNSGRYWKNRNNSNVSCVSGTSNSWGCQAANSDPNAGYSAGDWVCGSDAPVGNACGPASGGTGGLCRYASYRPASVTLKVGQSFTFGVNAFNPGPYQIERIRTVSANPQIATAVPASRNVCCGWVYGYYQTNWPVSVTALSEGKVRVTSTFSSSQTNGTCYGSGTVTISGQAPVWSCVNPGASCTSSNSAGGDVYKVKDNVTCKMPKVEDPSILAIGTPRYYMICHMFDSKGVENTNLTLKQNNLSGSFSKWAIKAGVSKFLCEFKYCVADKDGITTCSQPS